MNIYPKGYLYGTNEERIGNAVGVSYPDSLYDPKRFGNCVLWLRSDLGITKDVNNFISSWLDNSGLGNDATVSGDPTLVTNQINGYPVIRMVGNGPFSPSIEFDGLANSFVGGGAQGYTVFTVIKIRNLALDYDAFDLWGDGDAVKNFFFQTNSTQICETDDADKAPFYDSDPTALTLNQWFLVEVTRQIGATLPFVATTSWNGANIPLTYNSNGASGTLGAQTFTGSSIGPADTGDNVDLAELIVYNAPLSAPSIAEVKAYLNTRYGL